MESQDDQQGAADRGASVYVADAEMERARLGDMKDVFAGVANVSVGGAIPVAQKIFVNGIDMLNLVVSMDGVLQNNRVFHHASANVFDPGLLKFVRVDPGVAAADTGPNAVAGAVVMETKDATDVVSEGQTFGGDVRLGYADNGETFNRSLTVGAVRNGWEFLLYGRSATGENYEDGSGREVTGTKADMQTGLLKAAYESEAGHRIEASAQVLRDDALRNDRANFGSTGRLVRYDTERKNYSFSYSQTNATGLWDPEVTLGYSESFISAPIFLVSETETETFSGKIQNTFHLSETNTIVAGLDFYDRTGDYRSPILANFGRTSLTESARNIGLFAQARLEPTDRWTISTGARADFQSFDGENNFSEDYSGLSGNFSAIYKVNDQLSLRGGYSNVFGGLQIEDGYLYSQAPTIPSPPLPRPQAGWDYAGLDTARAQNINIGADWASGNFGLGGEIFYTEVKNARDAGDNFDFSSQGLNLYSTYKWDLGGLRFSYAFSEAERDGELVPTAGLVDFATPMGSVLALEIQHRLPAVNLLVGGSLDVALDYDPDYANASQTKKLDGYEVVNLFAEYSPPALPNFTFRGEILNLFDEDYADRATYGGDTSVAGFNTLKEPGRTFVIQAIAKF
ncbi:TonB-dependent receptor plug domain-containing protein [Shimia sp. MMG029]|uniref:TonB-dependent receptor plug domain-containing protein n=1 Tax=Shimia sp. MMG029 TaxID=3021978 RepID=UPI0022FEDA94|nr:TonB-dependent receptor [Shimia sp. MMG029]MDA5558778.1 TonB-dependent receptor [Shimia sp. MMG029]